MEKPRVREIAKEMGLPVFDKPDSQEICFVPDNDYAGLVERLRPQSATGGPILDESGREVGRHGGQHRFTIGQRRGLDLAVGQRVFVVAKDARLNTVTIGGKDRLLASGCTVGEANWLSPQPLEEREVWAKYRYNTPPARARVRVLPEGTGVTPSGRLGRFAVSFEEPQTAVAPGQAVVLYERENPDVVLGGGWIERSEPAPTREFAQPGM